MRVNVKPLTHWIIYKQYTVRFGKRTPTAVTGELTTDDGQIPFTYNPQTLLIQLPNRDITINEYGWEIDQESKV